MEKAKIRDLRNKEKYQVDDAYLNGYARICGAYATCVYNSLCRHANFHTQECWPAIDFIADEHNITKPTVVKALAILEKANIVQIIRERNEETQRQENNTYILIDKSEWVPKEELPIHKNKRGSKNIREENGRFKSRVNDMDTVGSRVNDTVDSRVNDMDCKVTNSFKVTNITTNTAITNIANEENNTANTVIANNSRILEEYINYFKSINPMYRKLFGNTSERAAMKRIMEVVPKEDLEFVLKNIEDITSRQFCPVFTKPTEMERQWPKILNFIKKEFNKRKSRVEFIS